MPHYLVVPKTRRDRAIHEKARELRLHWLRSYIDDVVDDPQLHGEPLAVRAVDAVLMHLAARNSWRVPDDPVAIASRLGVRPQRVRPAILRLLALRRFELVYEPDYPQANGAQIQLAIDPGPSQSGASAEPVRSQSGTSAGPLQAVTPADVSAQIQASLASAASNRLAQTRARAEEEGLPSNGTVASYDADLRMPTYAPLETTHRLAEIATRNEPDPDRRQRSIAVIHHEAAGLPENLVARALESYLGRHPQPRGPGYVVATLRKLRAEAHLPDTRPTITREPTL